MSIELSEKLLILDFGSQYTQLIARRVREHNVYCEIHPFHLTLDKIKAYEPKGIILSGGPSSVYAEKAPLPSREIFELGVPVLGICYGLQVIGFLLNGKVNSSSHREYGPAKLVVDDTTTLFCGLESTLDVWMSHGDKLEALPEGFQGLGHTANSGIAAVENVQKNIYGVQFHPEVVHTPRGAEILKNFLYRICHCTGNWTPEYFVETTIHQIREKVGHKRVICGLSGGVDSAVTAVLIHKAIGNQLTSIFVNNGVLRKNEAEEVRAAFDFLNLDYVDATEAFLTDLKGVVDPELKRKCIGHRFIEVFNAEAKRIGQVDFLAQGTLYPDVIESVSVKGPSATIKSHHNVGGLPEKMHLKLIEPLRELFKDEVRSVGKVLGIPEHLLKRHPFPGPGLAVRILGEVTPEQLFYVRQADAIFIQTLKEFDYYDKVWQAFAVLLPIRTVGVMGDERTYDQVIALRAVTSQDGMTADWAKLPAELLTHASNRIINEVKGVNRVVYDISTKPPGTIEWE